MTWRRVAIFLALWMLWDAARDDTRPRRVIVVPVIIHQDQEFPHFHGDTNTPVRI